MDTSKVLTKSHIVLSGPWRVLKHAMCWRLLWVAVFTVFAAGTTCAAAGSSSTTAAAGSYLCLLTIDLPWLSARRTADDSTAGTTNTPSFKLRQTVAPSQGEGLSAFSSVLPLPQQPLPRFLAAQVSYARSHLCTSRQHIHATTVCKCKRSVLDVHHISEATTHTCTLIISINACTTQHSTAQHGQ